jgi:hypothetical protein
MRFLFVQILFLLSFNVYSQSGQIVGHITNHDTLLAYNYWTLSLKQNDSTIKETATTANFKFENLPTGIYSLSIHQTGQRDLIIDSLRILKDTTINLNLGYPPPCKFIYLTYLKNEKPKCIIGGHTDNIIPIVYGLPTQKTMKKAKKGLVHLGGCIISDCDPHYYCTIHKIEL